MMDSQSPLDQETQKAPDPHIYKPDEGEDDEDEIDRRIRRADERLRRLTIVGSPEFNDDFLCEDTLTVEGGYDTGYAVNYVDCGAAAANQGATPPPPTCECDDTWDCDGGCTPPEGDCVHYLQFQVRLTQCDIDDGFSTLFQFNFNADPSAFDVFVTDTGWHFRVNFGTHLDIDASEVPIVACDCYDILVAFSDPGDPNPIDTTFCVNGVTRTGTLSRSDACHAITDLYVGDPFGGDVPTGRKYRHFVASPGFNLDTDSFDSLVDATVITEGGVNVLLLGSGSDIEYGLTNISWTIACDCP